MARTQVRLGGKFMRKTCGGIKTGKKGKKKTEKIRREFKTKREKG